MKVLFTTSQTIVFHEIASAEKQYNLIGIFTRLIFWGISLGLMKLLTTRKSQTSMQLLKG